MLILPFTSQHWSFCHFRNSITPITKNNKNSGIKEKQCQLCLNYTGHSVAWKNK